jgi:hypothetical protein
VRDRQDILPHRIAPEPVARATRWWLWGLWGIAIAGVVAWAGSAARALGAALLTFWLVSGAIGALMLFLWFGTAHVMGWANHNLFLLNPLAWLALPGAWRLLRGRTPVAGRRHHPADGAVRRGRPAAALGQRAATGQPALDRLAAADCMPGAWTFSLRTPVTWRGACCA